MPSTDPLTSIISFITSERTVEPTGSSSIDTFQLPAVLSVLCPIIGQTCHSLTQPYFGELINVTLAEDDAYSKLVDVVADVDVSDSLTTVPRQLNDRLTMLNTAR